MQIVWGKTEDAPALAQVFYDAVRLGPSPYTEAERMAWVPEVPDANAFATRLAAHQVAAAKVKGQLVGFMTLDATGYIDLVFILNAYRGQGIFRALFAVIEEKANAQALPRLSTHASLTAQPAFQAMGFSVIQHETVTRAGEELRRAEMEKHLT